MSIDLKSWEWCDEAKMQRYIMHGPPIDVRKNVKILKCIDNCDWTFQFHITTISAVKICMNPMKTHQHTAINVRNLKQKPHLQVIFESYFETFSMQTFDRLWKTVEIKIKLHLRDDKPTHNYKPFCQPQLIKNEKLVDADDGEE